MARENEAGETRAEVKAKRDVQFWLDVVMKLTVPVGAIVAAWLANHFEQNRANLQIMREMITAVPLIVDAGVGTASDAAVAMELGADGVLMNTAIAAAQEPEKMALAMKLGVEAGRLAYEAGRME